MANNIYYLQQFHSRITFHMTKEKIPHKSLRRDFVMWLSLCLLISHDHGNNIVENK